MEKFPWITSMQAVKRELERIPAKKLTWASKIFLSSNGRRTIRSSNTKRYHGSWKQPGMHMIAPYRLRPPCRLAKHRLTGLGCAK